MTTYKGRVVYERVKNPFKPADLARILRALTMDETPEVVQNIFSGLLVTYILNAAASVEEIAQLVIAMVKATINIMGGVTAAIEFIVSIFEYLVGVVKEGKKSA